MALRKEGKRWLGGMTWFDYIWTWASATYAMRQATTRKAMKRKW